MSQNQHERKTDFNTSFSAQILVGSSLVHTHHLLRSSNMVVTRKDDGEPSSGKFLTRCEEALWLTVPGAAAVTVLLGVTLDSTQSRRTI